jgi:hypothetical protein
VQPAGITGHPAGTLTARPIRDPEITAEDPAVAEHPGNPSCPKFPEKPDLPLK